MLLQNCRAPKAYQNNSNNNSYGVICGNIPLFIIKLICKKENLNCNYLLKFKKILNWFWNAWYSNILWYGCTQIAAEVTAISVPLVLLWFTIISMICVACCQFKVSTYAPGIERVNDLQMFLQLLILGEQLFLCSFAS